MEFNQTENDRFIEVFQSIDRHLPGEIVKKSYISIASHLFINFGEEIESESSNGKPYKKSPWTIWLGANVDWRLTQNGKFIVGSCQSYDQMNTEIQRLVGKKYLSCSIVSQFMDIQFEFEEGYQVTSFLNVLINEQWSLFCPNDDVIGLDAETQDEVEKIRQLSSYFDVSDLFKSILLPINHKSLVSFSLENSELYLLFEDNLSLCLDWCVWRIEKNEKYYLGGGEFDLKETPDIHQYLDELKGKKLIKSSVTHPFHDAKFEFEDGYVIQAFSCCKNPIPWRILKNNQEDVYSAKVSLEKA